MLKIYCQKCGGLNAYVSDKPRFCQKCGNTFGKLAVPNNLKAQTESSPPQEDIEIFHIPDIDGLMVDIDVSGPNTESIANLAGTGKEGLALENRAPLTPEERDTNPIEELKREGSAIKNK